MCTCNGERYLLEQLLSIADQRLLPDELIVCDDESTDSTESIVRSFTQSAPFPVRYIQNRRRLGVTPNFAQAIDLCSGDFIALADQDDVWHPNKLTISIEALSQDPRIGGIFSDSELINERSELIPGLLWARVPFRPRGETLSTEDFVNILLRQDVVTGATLVFRSNLKEKLLPIPDSWVHDAWIAWMLVLHSTLGFIRQPLMRYRIHGGQQISVPKDSLRERLGTIRNRPNSRYLELAKRYADLRSRLLSDPASGRVLDFKHLDRKIQLLHFQARLVNNRIARAGKIICVLPSYMRYTRGLVTICRDLLA
jgi:glycosyltransferase involved in cell wall biosynthesis